MCASANAAESAVLGLKRDGEAHVADGDSLNRPSPERVACVPCEGDYAISGPLHGTSAISSGAHGTAWQEDYVHGSMCCCRSELHVSLHGVSTL